MFELKRRTEAECIAEIERQGLYVEMDPNTHKGLWGRRSMAVKHICWIVSNKPWRQTITVPTGVCWHDINGWHIPPRICSWRTFELPWKTKDYRSGIGDTLEEALVHYECEMSCPGDCHRCERGPFVYEVMDLEFPRRIRGA